MSEKKERASAENVTKGNSGDKHEKDLHPLKGTVKEGYKDKDSNKKRLQGEDKEKLENQVQSATDNSNKKIADRIQNSEKEK
jgi:ribosome recycling factor